MTDKYQVIVWLLSKDAEPKMIKNKVNVLREEVDRIRRFYESKSHLGFEVHSWVLKPL